MLLLLPLRLADSALQRGHQTRHERVCQGACQGVEALRDSGDGGSLLRLEGGEAAVDGVEAGEDEAVIGQRRRGVDLGRRRRVESLRQGCGRVRGGRWSYLA